MKKLCLISTLHTSAKRVPTLWAPPTSEINTTTALPLEYLGLPSTTQMAIKPSKLASQTQAAISGKKAYGPYTIYQLSPLTRVGGHTKM